MGISTHRIGIARLLLVLLGSVLGWGCMGTLGPPPTYQYFASPDPDDAWSRKIGSWQRREQAPLESERAPVAVLDMGGDAAQAAADPRSLQSKYSVFLADQKRAVAREFAGWIQRQAQDHYVPDGPIDHWATLEETFRSNGDDCDGLELLAYNFLLEIGFRDDEVYRAIVVRPSDGQHHMVTLWFENSDDPWIIDPTGAMTSGMPRMSELPEWVPLKVFSEDRDFTVRRTALQTAQTR